MSSTNSENDDKLLNAAWKGDDATVSQLLTQGDVNVDARSEAGWTALYWASCRGHTDVVDLLAQARADTEAGDCDNATPLHKASEHGFVDTVRVLLVHGANASIQDNWGNKPIHMPLTNGSLGMHALCYTIRELVQHGAEWDDRCDHIVRQRPSRAGIRACIDLWTIEARQGTPLTNIPIEVIVRGDPAVRQYLSNIGPPASGGLTNWLLDNHDDSTFDNTMDATHDDMVHTGMDQASWTTNEMVGTRYTHNNLSNSGIDQYTSSVVVRPLNGVPRQIDVVPHLSDAGNSSLHDACVEGSLDMVRLLLETGANVNATNDAGLKPMHCALWKRTVSNPYELNGVFYLLANNGATWDATCDEMEQNLNTIYWAASLKRCMQWWETEKRHGRQLVEVPFEVQDGGNFDIDLYINNKIAERQRAETPPQHGVMFGRNVSNSVRERHQNVLALKVTVVGPSHKARDAIVESLAALKPVEPSYPIEEDHPLRVGVSRLSFSGYAHGNRPPNHHEVCVWDVHATEETMHACAMFFTRRALYVLCVDLVEFERVHLTGNDDDVQHFIQQHVLQWLKLIKKYHPNAQIVIAGTFTEDISDDITDQETALQNLQDSLASHQNVVGKCDWLAVGCDSVAQVLQARAQLESLIIQSKNNVALDEAAAIALDFTWEISSKMSSLEDSQLLEQGMSSLEDMRSEVASAVNTEASSTSSQDLLEKIAPIAPFLWYNIDGELLQAVVFGSPNVPTSYFNEILTHQSRDGESISHEAIMALPSWSVLTDNSVLALKQLLHRFEVVHALDEVIASDSKLLVPSYWKRSQHADTKYELASKPTINVHWQYQVTNLAPTTFDRLVVASYSPLFRRHIGDHYLLFKPSGDFVCRVRVTFGTGGTQRSVIHLEAQAASASSPMWCVFQHVGEAIERVVRGHDVTRLAFNDVGGDDRLETIVAEWVKYPPQFRATLTWLPPDLTWVYNRLLAKSA